MRYVYSIAVNTHSFLPTGEPNAAETPAAAPADTKSRFSTGERK